MKALGPREVAVSKDRTREQALERLKALGEPFPPDFRFDREEANAR